MNILKSTIVSLALGIAKSIVTPELIKGEARKGLNALAAKAHAANGSTEAVMNRAANLLAVMKDGRVDAEETELLLGDVVTQKNIDLLFDYIKGAL